MGRDFSVESFLGEVAKADLIIINSDENEETYVEGLNSDEEHIIDVVMRDRTEMLVHSSDIDRIQYVGSGKYMLFAYDQDPLYLTLVLTEPLRAELEID